MQNQPDYQAHKKWQKESSQSSLHIPGLHTDFDGPIPHWIINNDTQTPSFSSSSSPLIPSHLLFPLSWWSLQQLQLLPRSPSVITMTSFSCFCFFFLFIRMHCMLVGFFSLIYWIEAEPKEKIFSWKPILCFWERRYFELRLMLFFACFTANQKNT